jgi:S-DNA-T family DNA segregation ATPase FtsK/SpoIIIE
LGEPEYLTEITELPPREDDEPGLDDEGGSGDDLFDKAVALVVRDGKASTSYIQRRLSIGYNRAADLMERMEAEGIVSPANSVGKRDILAGRDGSPVHRG